jgi:transposase
MLPPNNVSVSAVGARDRHPARHPLRLAPPGCWRGASPASRRRPRWNSWSSEEKFAVVMETASLNELELGAYCRRKGPLPRADRAWRDDLPPGQHGAAEQGRAGRAAGRARGDSRLTRELQRKDRALAEAAALLVLQKKVRAIWEEPEDAPSPTNGASQVSDWPSPRPAPRGRALQPACAAVGLTLRTLQRWRRGGTLSGRCAHAASTGPTAPCDPANRLSGADERTAVGGGQRAALRQLEPPPDRPGAGRRGLLPGLGIDLLPPAARADQLTRRGRPRRPPASAPSRW